jgi:U4/U6 small nuclear ribonucleoprotein PRP4
LKEVIGSLELDQQQLDRLQDLINKNIPLTSFTTTAPTSTAVSSSSKTAQSSKEVFYTNATENLIIARKEISTFSFLKCKDRIVGTKRRRDTFSAKEEDNQSVSNLYNLCEEVVLNSSQYADARPLTCIRYSKCGNIIATGSLASHVKLWDVNTLNCTGLLRGHEERITSVEWNPMNGSNDSILLASTGADATCKLYDCRNNMTGDIYQNQNDNNGTNGEKKDDIIESLLPIREFKGHKGIVADCEFHPNGRYIATAGHDYSWRLWDVETGQELLLQDGHINECAELSFHPDGSLIITTD